MTRPVAEVIEDLTDLDSFGVGATDAAKRTGFPTPHAMERWLHRQKEYPLWLRMKARDPEGMHDPANRRLHMTENSTDAIAALISRAQKSSRKRTRTKADKVSDLVADLRHLLDVEEHEDKAREVARKDVERLERELREAKAILKGGSATPATTEGPSAADIREWARAEGVDCPAMGRIPESVRAAYLEADEQQAS